MSVMTGMPRGVIDWTVADLERLPDDGNQYELLDGMLLVTPAPIVRHQVVVSELFAVLRASTPPGMRALLGPLDWQPDERTSLQPDVLVIWDRDLDARNVTYPLPLAVEVLSPSTRRKDLLLKRSKYQDAGVQSYWIFDPVDVSLTVLEPVDGAYVETGHVKDDEILHVELPFHVDLVPARLFGG